MSGNYINSVSLSKSACLNPWKGLKCAHSGDRFFRHFLSSFGPLRRCWNQRKARDFTLREYISVTCDFDAFTNPFHKVAQDIKNNYEDVSTNTKITITESQWMHNLGRPSRLQCWDPHSDYYCWGRNCVSDVEGSGNVKVRTELPQD